MPYNFELAVSAQISEKVVKEMITRIVEEQTGKKVSNIDMKFRTVTRGIGPAETSERVFDGCAVQFANEQPTQPLNADLKFKKDVY